MQSYKAIIEISMKSLDKKTKNTDKTYNRGKLLRSDNYIFIQ